MPALASAPGSFLLERSTNRNRLVVDVDLARADPVHPSWRMLESDGHVEELTSFERSHLYGVEVTERSAGELLFHFHALPSLAFHVRESNDTFVPISGVERRVRRIFLRLSGGIFPSLASAEFDVEVADGSAHAYEFFPRDGTWKDGGPR